MATDPGEFERRDPRGAGRRRPAPEEAAAAFASAGRIGRALCGDAAWHEPPPPVAVLRVAFAPCVAVREAPSTQALAVGFRSAGDLVRAVGRRGRWVLLLREPEEAGSQQEEEEEPHSMKPRLPGRLAGRGGSTAGAAVVVHNRARESWMLTTHEAHGALLEWAGGDAVAALPVIPAALPAPSAG